MAQNPGLGSGTAQVRQAPTVDGGSYFQEQLNQASYGCPRP
jgi:hypothetical protein